MFTHSRLLVVALVATTLLTAAAVARVNPAGLLSRSVRPVEALALSAEYARAAPLDHFLHPDRTDAGDRQRWRQAYDRSGALIEALLPRVRRLPGHWHLLVVAKAGCGDAVNSVPHFARLADASPNLELRILDRSEGAALLEAYPLGGQGRVPLVVVLDGNHSERGVWIERPAALHERVAAWTAEPPPEGLGSRIRSWYAADGGRSALEELVVLLERAAEGGAVVPSAMLDAPVTQCGVD